MATSSGKLEADVELKSSAEKFYTTFKSQAHLVPQHAPNHIKAVKVHEGEWETSGSIKIWNYIVDGKEEVFKERIEFDDEKKTIALNGLEGHVMEIYNIFKPVYELVTTGERSLAKCTIEYEKKDDKVPAPDKYMDFMINLAKAIDESLATA